MLIIIKIWGKAVKKRKLHTTQKTLLSQGLGRG
jgi:hypothetical protein